MFDCLGLVSAYPTDLVSPSGRCNGIAQCFYHPVPRIGPIAWNSSIDGSKVRRSSQRSLVLIFSICVIGIVVGQQLAVRDGNSCANVSLRCWPLLLAVLSAKTKPADRTTTVDWFIALRQTFCNSRSIPIAFQDLGNRVLGAVRDR